MADRDRDRRPEVVGRKTRRRKYVVPCIRKIKLQAAVNTGQTGNVDGLAPGTEV